jgi:galactokinase
MPTKIQVIKAFGKNFKTVPKLFFSPGRINLIGEHIDYNDGFVLPAAIDKGIWIALAPNYTNTVNIISLDFKEHFSFELSDVSRSTGWKNYVMGVLNTMLNTNLPFNGFDCVLGSNLPMGSGLASSAAIECGLMEAINNTFHIKLFPQTIAALCQQAEHTYPEVKCGIMDQFANMLGKKDHVILLDCSNLEHKYIPIKLNDYAIVVINSGVRHTLINSEYNLRRRQCWKGLNIIKNLDPYIHTFRDLDVAKLYTFEKELSKVVFKRCMYVVEEIKRTKRAADLLKQSRFQEMGQLMYQSHEGLRKQFEVSCAELNFLVDQSSQYSEVVGARLMGGGFGGSSIHLIEKENAPEIVKEISSAYKNKFKKEAESYFVKISKGTHQIAL